MGTLMPANLAAGARLAAENQSQSLDEKTARTYELRLIALEKFARENGDDAVLFGPNKRPFLAATIQTFIQLMGETKGKRLGTLRCRGLKPPVLRGHAAAFKYWFDAFGHSGPYSQDIQEIDGVQKVIPKGNPMESPGESPCCCCFPEFFSVKGIFYHEVCRCQKDNEAVNQKGSQANKIRHTKGPCAL